MRNKVKQALLCNVFLSLFISTGKAQVIFYFDFNIDTPIAKQTSLINQVIDSINLIQPDSIMVVGHTDTVGSKTYNQVLSERRAAYFAVILKENLPYKAIYSEGKSKYQTVSTKNQDQNRRVEIYFRKHTPKLVEKLVEKELTKQELKD